ncbi:hypothetical protein GQ457_05G018970 [Hibiscus cannabinus]
MALMAWNVRGIGNKEIVRALMNIAFKIKCHWFSGCCYCLQSCPYFLIPSWLLEDECSLKFQEGWEPINCQSSKRFGNKLNRNRSKLVKKSKRKYGRIKKMEEGLKRKIKSLQDKTISTCEAEDLRKLKQELDRL